MIPLSKIIFVDKEGKTDTLARSLINEVHYYHFRIQICLLVLLSTFQISNCIFYVFTAHFHIIRVH